MLILEMKMVCDPIDATVVHMYLYLYLFGGSPVLYIRKGRVPGLGEPEEQEDCKGEGGSHLLQHLLKKKE